MSSASCSRASRAESGAAWCSTSELLEVTRLRCWRVAGTHAPDESAEPGVPLADAGRGDVAARIGCADDGDGVAGRQVADLRLARLADRRARTRAHLDGRAVGEFQGDGVAVDG